MVNPIKFNLESIEWLWTHFLKNFLTHSAFETEENILICFLFLWYYQE